jgi:hypothetical protein
MAGLRRRRGAVAAGVAVLVALIGVVAVTGSREPASALKLLPGHAWLANRLTGTVSDVNGYSGEVDGQAAVTRPGDPFTVIQRPDGAYVLDRRTGKLSRLAASSLALAATRHQAGRAAALQVLTGTSATYVLDRSTGLLQQVDRLTLAPIGRQIPLGGATGTATIDADDAVWAPLAGTPTVVEVAPGGQVSRHKGGGRSGSLQVVDTQTGVWSVDPAAGSVTSLSAPSAAPVTIPADTGAPLVGASDASPYIVINTPGQVLEVDTVDSSLSSVATPATGGAVQIAVNGDDAYLLDATADDLLTLDLQAASVGPSVSVPTGSDQIVTQDQQVYVNDDGGPDAVVVNSDGQVTPITKYTTTAQATPAPGQDPAPSVVNIPTIPATQTTTPSLTPTPGPPGAGGTGAVSASGPTLPVVTLPVPVTPTTAPPTTAPPTTVPAPTTRTTAAPGAPTAPGGVTASATADGTVAVSWTAPSSDGGAAITAYSAQVTDQTTGKVDGPSKEGPGTLTETFTGLTNGDQWCAQVQAVNSAGAGPVSAASPAACATPQADLPSAVTITAATPSPTAGTDATVTWTAATDSGTGVTITDYLVSDGVDATPVTVAAPAVSTSFTTLKPDTAYAFTVTAVNSLGHQGPVSARVAMETDGPPTALTGLTAKAGTTTIAASWNASTAANGQAVSYAVTVSPATTTSYGGGTSFTFAARAATTYTVTVTPKTAAGSGTGAGASAEDPYSRETVYLCVSNSQGDEFVTTSSTCEGGATSRVNGSPGFSFVPTGTTGTGAETLHRYLGASGTAQSHYWGTSAPADSVAPGGWTDEGAVAVVFPSAADAGPGSVEVCDVEHTDANGPYWLLQPGSSGTCFWT